MKLKVRGAEGGDVLWGFLESWGTYHYKGVLTVKHVFALGSEPLIHRGGVYEGLSVVEEEMGIGKYIRAKKPFYSPIKESALILKADIPIQEGTGIVLGERVSISFLEPITVVEGELYTREIPSSVEELSVVSLGDLNNMYESLGDREKFLRGRVNLFKA